MLSPMRFAFLVLVVACSGQQPAGTPPPPPPDPGALAADAAPAVVVVPPPADAAPAVVVPPPSPPPDAAPALVDDGWECQSNAECKSGVCEGAGCEDASGTCVPRDRACTADVRTYCGCDGKNFQGSGSCPGRIYDYRGPCKTATQWKRGEAPDFASCVRADQCKSGVCEGEGCDATHPGTCQPAGRGCPQNVVQYCGCDGKSFASNPCPGRRYAHLGGC
jgi:hypothetical protein